jgi:hypothetical protein
LTHPHLYDILIILNLLMHIVTTNIKREYGFSNKEKASQAGKKAHELKKAHQWDTKEAKKAADKRWEEKKKDNNSMRIL